MFRRTFITTAAVAAVAAAPAAAKPADVLITNTLENPVPVTGTVGLASGTAVGLAPGTAVGLTPGAAVGIDPAANDVDISASAPIPVTQAPAKAVPQMHSSDITLPDGDNRDTALLIPAGELGAANERYEPTFASARTILPDGVAPEVTIQLLFNGTQVLRVPMQPMEVAGPNTLWVGSVPLQGHSTGGVTWTFQRVGGSSGNALTNLTLVGRRVDETAPAS